MRKLVVAALGVFLLFGACTQAAAPTPGDLGEFRELKVGFYSITKEEIQEIVDFLASPEREGRRNGTEDSSAAGEFIAQDLAASSVQPLGPDHFQLFRFSDIEKGRLSLSDIERLRGLGWEISLEGRNVMGVLYGTTLNNEYVVIGAHYDHVGIQFGKLHPGADDNASGSAAVLEIAEAFGMLAKQGTIPQRSIIFALFDAEEWGLWGSQYFVENSPVPVENIVAMINLDMISRNKSAELNVFGSPDIEDFAKRSPRLSRALNKANAVLEFELQYPAEEGRREKIFLRSDHASFFFACPEFCRGARPEGNRIPVVFLTAGLHNDYHTPGDTAKRINSEKARDVARLAFLTAWQIADADERPVFVEK